MSRIVIALGGNALGNTPAEQQNRIREATKQIASLIALGHEIILTHGNGPQVGIINLAFEDSYENKDIPYMPFPECTAMSQGYIGYHLQKGLKDALKEYQIEKDVVTVVTQVMVDESDPSFQDPTKPVGPFYTKEMANELMEKTGERYIEDAGRGYRKVVASPKPLQIVELSSIQTLLNHDTIVIACGGGGIPVLKQDPTKGVSAVIDKDLASSLLAIRLKADLFVILTNVEQVSLYYGTEQAKLLSDVSVEEMKGYIQENHFAKGSMLPKVEAALNFVQETTGNAIITSLENVSGILSGQKMTTIHS